MTKPKKAEELTDAYIGRRLFPKEIADAAKVARLRFSHPGQIAPTPAKKTVTKDHGLPLG